MMTRFYHIHKVGNYDEQWKEGNKINVSYDNPFWTFSMNIVLGCPCTPLNEYQMLLRELGMEYVREKFFPKYPSRKKCIWLIRPEETQLRYWSKQIDRSDTYIFEIETLGGKIFKGRNGLLPAPNSSYKEITEKAMNYWQCDPNTECLDDEYLYEGIIRIVREIPRS